jgi:hypothetical protein
VAGRIRLEQLMKFQMIILGAISGMCCGAGTGQAAESKAHAEDESFKVVADQFADIQVLRYQAPGFDQLTLQQKKLAYFLTEAGLAGRDIFYDQKYRHNLLVRKTRRDLSKLQGQQAGRGLPEVSGLCEKGIFRQWHPSSLLEYQIRPRVLCFLFPRAAKQQRILETAA